MEKLKEKLDIILNNYNKKENYYKFIWIISILLCFVIILVIDYYSIILL